jgi:protein involved in polysaccharide export with SLBB domain
MVNIKIGFAAIALALAANALAQEKTDFKSDLFGQEAQSSVGEVAPVQAPHKVSITNGSTSDAAAAGTAAVPSASNRIANNAQQSEFQKFIADNLDRTLPIFGSEFFANAPSTFAPIANAPVPTDYRLGPGDQLLIRGWGTVDIDYRATIDRNGAISLPTLGTIPLAGVKAGEAESVIRGAVGRLYKGVTVSVTFGQLRAITVYVVGQAQRPGTYTVSSLSTLVTTLFASGGPNGNGSMRHVQVKRAGNVAAELDLYSFIAKGDKSADIKLLDGDTIYIPPAGGFVALVGKVNSPAIYELKGGADTIGSLLDIAGGLPVVADPRRAFLERINPEKNHPRTVEEFALDPQGLTRPLKNGDVLNITAIAPDFANAVILRGSVSQPVRAPFRQGMHVSDLIPSREYLITRASVKRQNSAIVTGDNERATNESDGSIAGRIGGLIDPINWDYAVVERVNRSDVSVSLIPFNLGNVFSNPGGADNIQLQPGDTVTVFSQTDVAVPLDKRRVFVRVEGEVKVPGVYQMTAGDTLQSMLAKAGGPTSNAYLFGTEFYRETARREQQVNLEKAADKLENQLRSEQAKGAANIREVSGTDAAVVQAQRQMEMEAAKDSLNRFRHLKATGRIALSLDPDERSFARLPQLKLENGDRLVVPSKPAFVSVFGAVNVESSLLWRPNSRVSDYLKLAGLTPDADVDNVFVMRADGSVVSGESKGWFFGSIGGLGVMPGDSVVIPQKFDRESRWTAFTRNTREWAQIFANFGLGAAAIKTLRN